MRKEKEKKKRLWLIEWRGRGRREGDALVGEEGGLENPCSPPSGEEMEQGGKKRGRDKEVEGNAEC